MCTESVTKKFKFTPTILSITGNNEQINKLPSASVLTIKDNNSLNEIKNCSCLTLLKMSNTKVKKIKNCPVLYCIDIENNFGLGTLYSPSAYQCCIKNAKCLHSVILENAEIVELNRLPLLQNIIIPNAKIVTLSNTNLVIDFNNMSKLKMLTLTNLKDIPLNVVRNLHLDKLVIKNCNIEIISELFGFNQIIIENCSNLFSVKEIKNVINLTINDCENLYEVQDIYDISTVILNKCTSLEKLDDINVDEFKIIHAMDLLKIQNVIATKMLIINCPFVIEIDISGTSELVHIENCKTLETINFDCSNTFSYSNLTIELIGDNQIDEIKDWYLKKLYVEDNRCITSISNLYNLYELKITGCLDLHTISNTFVAQSIFIQCCPSLDEVNDVYGYKELELIDCEKISNFSTRLTELYSINIQKCPLLNLVIDGSLLKNLVLIDTGFMVIKNMSIASEVSIDNADLLPDLQTNIFGMDTPPMDEDIVFPEAEQLANHMRKLSMNATFLSRKIRSYLDRINYLKYLNARKNNNLSNCAICLDEICILTSSFTPCNHVFHRSCIITWINNRRICPLCNRLL